MRPDGNSAPPRILVVDDNASIHEDFRKILGNTGNADRGLDEMESALFGSVPDETVRSEFVIDSACQGQEALAMVRRSVEENRPYALAFVDIRMPPGWDGVETLEQIWKVYPELQAVICTAHTDYSWEDVTRRLGHAADLLILKKPFETVEVLQMAHALTHKWSLAQKARLRLEDLEHMVARRTEELLRANRHLEEEMEGRKRMQSELRGSQERFSKAFQMAPIPMAVVRCVDCRFVDANPAFADLLGRPRDAIVQSTDTDLQLWSECDDAEILEKYPRRRIRNRICKIRGGDSQIHRTVCSSEPVVLDSDPCALLIFEDLTDLFHLEEQLRQAQKMESVGLLAAGVAHEFNNILTVIQGNINLVQISGTLPEDASEAYDQILKASERAATLTSQLLAFSRKGMLQPRQVDLSAVVRGCENMLGTLLGEHFSLEVTCDEGLATVLADENSLVQILMNLVANARDATARGGTISIRSSQVEFDAAAAEGMPEARSGRFAVLSVSDTGSGMDPEVLRRIFDPFYTTKEPGCGTGLGLSMVLGIVKQQHGWIDVLSDSGGGTTFSIYLPNSENLRPATSGQETIAEGGYLPHGEGETVLVVEDEAQLRELTCLVLRKHGYDVYSCESGREALDTWGTNDDRLDLLFTDVAMPGGVMGDELARALRAGRPDMGIICASGYSPQSLPQDIRETLSAHFLQKPYTFDELLQLIRACLAEMALPAPAAP